MTTTNPSTVLSEQLVELSLAMTSNSFARVEGLWFEDGGLIIRADNTVFRVYRDMLATHASGFAGMLAGASPEFMDGCPFVHLPDSAKDMEYFLKALFDFRFFRPYPALTTFPILAGVLRMSHRYDAADLLKRALFHFSTPFPTSLAEWENNSAGVSWTRKGYALPIIAVARQVSADWIIPAALYHLCETLKEEEILDGVVVSGSTLKLDRRG
ncbi:hypothetical protein C8F04DRAFT_1039380 [Mycena alexandri]|uniref:BTB domain-containing protein n=1 Tax=Mycena alexandri TaxID=1745969 RepID=A0AAD6X1X1_9AGAR|nr:hypothetical protein C8F04DRAFT_1039380 [Mycena alexandri]